MRTFEEWFAITPNIAKAAIIDDVHIEGNCLKFFPLWTEFKDAFSAYLASRFGNGTPDRDFNALLDDFFSRERPDLLLRGCILAIDQFNDLARLIRDIDLSWLDETRWDDTYLSKSDLANLTDDEFDDYFGGWPALGITISGRRGPAWAFDWNELSSLAGFTGAFDRTIAEKLIDILGFVDLDKVKRTVLIRYHRTRHVVEPRTPTVIDGIGHPLFRLPTKCDSKGGQTFTVRGASGVREAVHARVRVKGADWNSANIA